MPTGDQEVLKYLGVKLALVTLVFLVCPGLPKFFQLSQPPMTGYLLTVLMSCKGELAFYSGEGTRETSTTCHDLQDLMMVLTGCFRGLLSTLHPKGRSHVELI